MKNLIQEHKKFWDAYLSVSKLPANGDYSVVAEMAGNDEITDELIVLYRTGKKNAGSSVVEDFISAGDPLPKVGNYWILLNSKAEPEMILKTIRTETHKFSEVPESVAIAEGEGDLSLDYWKRVHSDLYLPYLKEWGVATMDEATVITEFFEIVYRKEMQVTHRR